MAKLHEINDASIGAEAQRDGIGQITTASATFRAGRLLILRSREMPDDPASGKWVLPNGIISLPDIAESITEASDAIVFQDTGLDVEFFRGTYGNFDYRSAGGLAIRQVNLLASTAPGAVRPDISSYSTFLWADPSIVNRIVESNQCTPNMSQAMSDSLAFRLTVPSLAS